MIKLQNDIVYDDNPLGDVLTQHSVIDELKLNGVDVGNHDKPDFIFALANDLKEVKPNTIAFEKLDGCQIKNKKLLDDPNLLSLVKMYKYKDWETNNMDCCDGRIFTRFLSENWIAPQKILLSEEQCNKVKTGSSFLHYIRHDVLEDFIKTMNIDSCRDVDVYFGGTTTYGKHGHKSGSLITKHRLDCIRAISELRIGNVLTTTTREFNYATYLHKLLNIKVVVSPWGWGESCYRDYEAIVCGCELIKPRSYKIESNPDIYNEKFMYFCEPDWSDLAEVMEKIMDNYQQRRAKRTENSRYLVAERQPERIAEILKGLLK